jgi:hypothetical protein
MSLNASDYNEILSHLRKEVQNAKLVQIDAAIMEDIKFSETPKQELTYYLKGLFTELSLISRKQFLKTQSILNECVRTENGKPIEGIKVELTSQERQVFQVEEIDLSEALIPEEAIKGIFELIEIIQATEMDNPGQNL